MFFHFFLLLLPFCAPKNIYNKTLSKELWDIARLAYSIPEESKKGQSSLNFTGLIMTDINVYSYNSLFIYNLLAFSGYLKNSNIVFLAFRGTKTRNNWLQNLNMFKQNFPKCLNCKVH